MLKNSYEKLPLGAIKVEGWLQDQLITQANGLTGNVRFLFKDLSDNSAWLGGNGESWERGPYYLDGLLPLAYQTQDEVLIKESKKWFDAIFASQREDGFFGPDTNYDWWPRMVITKQMPSYYEVTNDPRVIPFLDKYYKYVLKNIDNRPYYSWANARGYEESIGLCWLYSKTMDSYLLELAKKIIDYSMDFCKVFSDFPYTKPSADYCKSGLFNIKKVLFYASDAIRNWSKAKPMKKKKILKRNNAAFNVFYHLTHGVNLAMALKYPALQAKLSDNPALKQISKKGYSELMKRHGNATALFSGDEHLSGVSPTQGIELCSVAEAMYSFEKLFLITGDTCYCDYLEQLAFNAFPATFTADMSAHQYVQQANQISATVAKRNWYDSYSKANIYGLKPNYPCCLSNMHQGFPRFAEHIACKSDDGIFIVSPIDCSILTTVDTHIAELKISGGYPFSKNVEIAVINGRFNLHIRKPHNTRSITIQSNHSTQITEMIEDTITISVAEGDRYKLCYNNQIVGKTNWDKSLSYYYGNVLLAYGIEGKTVMKTNDRFSDREVFPLSRWNYAPNFSMGYFVEFLPMQKIPFSMPQMKVTVYANAVKNWKEKKNSADCIPLQPDYEQAEQICLVPYGATDLRISHFAPPKSEK